MPSDFESTSINVYSLSFSTHIRVVLRIPSASHPLLNLSDCNEYHIRMASRFSVSFLYKIHSGSVAFISHLFISECIFYKGWGDNSTLLTPRERLSTADVILILYSLFGYKFLNNKFTDRTGSPIGVLSATDLTY